MSRYPEPHFKGEHRRAIVADWAQRFPALTPRPAMPGAPRLLRRLGPLVQGICLERQGDPRRYRPVSFLHFLGYPFPVLSLAMEGWAAADEWGVPDETSVGMHPRDVDRLAGLIRKRTAVSLDTRPGLGDVVAAYERRAKIRLDRETPSETYVLTDMVLVPAACGRPDVAARALTWVERFTKGWKPTEDFPSRTDWLQDLADRARDVAALQDVIATEAVRHKVDDLSIIQLA